MCTKFDISCTVAKCDITQYCIQKGAGILQYKYGVLHFQIHVGGEMAYVEKTIVMA